MRSAKAVEDILVHYGKKGMRWGIRTTSTGGSQKVTVSEKGKRIKTSGGAGHPAHSDAVRARSIGQIGKKSGLKSLSDKELQDYSRRLTLEQNVKRLRYNDMSPGKKFVASLLGQTGKSTAQSVANDVAGQQVKKHLGKKLALGAAAAAA